MNPKGAYNRGGKQAIIHSGVENGHSISPREKVNPTGKRVCLQDEPKSPHANTGIRLESDRIINLT